MKPFRYISIFSGIEAASAAWAGLGWEPVAFSEIEPFPCRVLQHHYPNVPNLGDITKIDWRPYVGAVDLVVGGSPCQSFSIAGTQTGLDGASGLVREYFRCLEIVRPSFFLWENVPGALSSSHGEDYAFILRQWDKLGYHVAWRVLDAEFFGVAQRRRRVFAFGSLRDWRDPIKVLFERESLCRNPKPRKKKGEADTPAAGTGAGEASRRVARMAGFGHYTEDGTASALKARDYKDCTDLVYSIQGNTIDRQIQNGGNCAGFNENVSYTLNTIDRHAVCPIAFKIRQGKEGGGKGYLGSEDKAFTLSCNQDQQIFCAPVAPCIGASGPPYSRPGNERVETEALCWADARVRRLTPIECLRLQGFPDDYLDLEGATDTQKYKAIGNSMAVPVMRWIGERIAKCLS